MSEDTDCGLITRIVYLNCHDWNERQCSAACYFGLPYDGGVHMKIKTAKMGYEEVLALPVREHEKPIRQ